MAMPRVYPVRIEMRPRGRSRWPGSTSDVAGIHAHVDGPGRRPGGPGRRDRAQLPAEVGRVLPVDDHQAALDAPGRPRSGSGTGPSRRCGTVSAADDLGDVRRGRPAAPPCASPAAARPRRAPAARGPPARARPSARGPARRAARSRPSRRRARPERPAARPRTSAGRRPRARPGRGAAAGHGRRGASTARYPGSQAGSAPGVATTIARLVRHRAPPCARAWLDDDRHPGERPADLLGGALGPHRHRPQPPAPAGGARPRTRRGRRTRCTAGRRRPRPSCERARRTRSAPPSRHDWQASTGT